jgi:D-alanine-D-alanine ligase
VDDVILLFGGASSERLVSVASAQNVSRRLPEARPWFLSQALEVHDVPAARLQAHEAVFQAPFVPGASARWPSLAAALDTLRGRGAAVFLALHGGEGEDGTVQSLLEARGLAFTGSGARASADAFDKARAKALAAARGARVADARELPPSSEAELLTALEALLAEHPRWVLKPRSDGSSHGLKHLAAREQVPEAAALLARLQRAYLAERFIAGRELTVGVVEEGGGAAALPVSEVVLEPGAAFDYQGKYLGRGTREVTPAALAVAEREAAQALALLTHRAVGCAGYSRTDMMLAPDGLVLLEINTLPGLTQASFIPQQLQASGRDLEAFLRGQLDLARARANRTAGAVSAANPGA